jgi:NADPH:quinone reductase-like Zn-dependent oxidoreductase
LAGELKEGPVKAIVQNAYGSVDALTLADIDMPTAGDDQVLVRVHATSLHAGDWFVLLGVPYPARFAAGWPKPKNFVPGLSTAGVVEAVGAKVSGLKPGDEVYGECQGACAEYALGSENTLVAKPAGLTFEQAAAFPTSALAALHELREAAKVQPGQRVLINGASGGVGIYAVQIAKAMGAHVTGVCSSRNVEMVRGLGAEDVIDYTVADFASGGQTYDLILDNVGDRPFSELRRALTPDGVLQPNSGRVSVGSMLGGMIRSFFVHQQGRMYLSLPNREDLLALSELVDSGKLRTVIDRTYPLAETPEALAYVGTGHASGKVVIRVLAEGEGTPRATA